MSRYKVQYLPGGIQRDVGLAVRMRREAKATGECEQADCEPTSGGAFWYNPATDAFDLASAEITDLADSANGLIARVIMDNACPCDVSWQIVADFPSYPITHTWDEATRAWTPTPTWGMPTPIFVEDALIFVGDTSTFVYEANFTLTCTPTVCNTAGDPVMLHSAGA